MLADEAVCLDVFDALAHPVTFRGTRPFALRLPFGEPRATAPRQPIPEVTKHLQKSSRPRHRRSRRRVMDTPRMSSSGIIRPMAVGRRERFESIRPRVVELYGTANDTIERVARVFELMELAWHDAYGEPAPPQNVVDDVLTCSRGTLEGLVDAAHLAVVDSRDLAVAASRVE